MANPIVLIHGYSDTGFSFQPWRDALVARGYDRDNIHICNYRSLTNEITIKDIGEGLDRALRANPKIGAEQPFDAIVHSTGMLVIRQWLSTYPVRRGRLKRLIALAPATFGSPLAHQGRGVMGALFKGDKRVGPDFLEVGDLVLDGLELGSRFTWDLTHQDLLCETPQYGLDETSPYVFIFCGTQAYGGFRRLINEPGTDGTVRWAGCGLTTQKLVIDLTRDGAHDPAKGRFLSDNITSRATLAMPFWPIAGLNHGTIVSDPTEELVSMVADALRVENADQFGTWQAQAKQTTAATMADLPAWQQFVVRAIDERGDPISDYFIELYWRDARGDLRPIPFDFEVHAYRADPSLRCFHVNLTGLTRELSHETGKDLEKEPDAFPPLWVRVIARSGSALVGYHGVNSERLPDPAGKMNEKGVWDAEISLPETFGKQGVRLFFPFTTTFIELKLNRDPTPFGADPCDIITFL